MQCRNTATSAALAVGALWLMFSVAPSTAGAQQLTNGQLRNLACPYGMFLLNEGTGPRCVGGPSQDGSCPAGMVLVARQYCQGAPTQYNGPCPPGWRVLSDPTGPQCTKDMPLLQEFPPNVATVPALTCHSDYDCPGAGRCEGVGYCGRGNVMCGSDSDCKYSELCDTSQPWGNSPGRCQPRGGHY